MGKHGNFYLSVLFVKQKQELVVLKAQKLGHEIVYSEYNEQLSKLSVEEIQTNKPKNRFRSTKKAILQIRCQTHLSEGIKETTVSNYLKARNGLTCCGRDVVSKKLKGREFSPETLQKMSTARKAVTEIKFSKASHSNKQLERQRLAEWRAVVFRNGEYCCAISGVKRKSLNAHHLFSKKIFSSIKYDPENGVLLHEKIHQLFHNTVGSLYIVTIDHFIEFLQKFIDDENFKNESFQKKVTQKSFPTYKKPTSNKLSSPQKIQDKCSETKTHENIKKIRELLERMTELKPYLFSKLTENEKKIAAEAFKNRILARGYISNKNVEESFQSFEK
jgi:hypothetical protein